MSDTIPQRADDTAGPAGLASTASGTTNSLRPGSERSSAADGDSATLDAMGAIPVVATEGAVVTGSARLEMTRSATQLEEEGEIAADYIEELLDITDLDGDIDIDAHDGRAYLAVNSSLDSNLRLLSKPDTVNALQELTRIAVQAKTGVFSRLILDVGGSRQARESELSQLVGRAAERIEGGAQSAALPPMSSYERKLVHDLVAARGFVSQSEGEGADRHTVITRA
jgi:spoIIIJ-associated protein